MPKVHRSEFNALEVRLTLAEESLDIARQCVSALTDTLEMLVSAGQLQDAKLDLLRDMLNTFDGVQVVKPADPELERLLAEEEAIERQNAVVNASQQWDQNAAQEINDRNSKLWELVREFALTYYKDDHGYFEPVTGVYPERNKARQSLLEFYFDGEGS